MTAAHCPIRIGVAGAAGRMGMAMVRACASHPEIVLAAALVRPSSAALGEDAGARAGCDHRGVPLMADVAAFVAGVDVIVDVSTGATRTLSRLAQQTGRPLVVACSALDAAAEVDLEHAARRIAVVRVANGSLGIAALSVAVEWASLALGPGFDIEILDIHHRMKKDAPSGTAVALGEAVARATGRARNEIAAVHGRDDASARRVPGSLGFAAVRGGDESIEHRVLFLGDGEMVSLGHVSVGREVFANGIIRAALFAHTRAPGLYSMRDVLGIG